MSDDKHLEIFLDLCQAACERMKRDGTWPWPDSPNSENVIESDGTTNDA